MLGVARYLLLLRRSLGSIACSHHNKGWRQPCERRHPVARGHPSLLWCVENRVCVGRTLHGRVEVLRGRNVLVDFRSIYILRRLSKVCRLCGVSIALRARGQRPFHGIKRPQQTSRKSSLVFTPQFGPPLAIGNVTRASNVAGEFSLPLGVPARKCTSIFDAIYVTPSPAAHPWRTATRILRPPKESTHLSAAAAAYR